MSAALPPQLALRREAQTLPQRILAERTEGAVRDLLEDFNARVRECWRRPVEGPMVVVRTVDVERLVEQWRAQQPARPAPAVPPPDTAEPSRSRAVRRALGRLLRRR